MTPELKTRWIWGVTVGLVVLVTMFWMGPEASFFLATVAGILGWREYCRLMDIESRPAFLYLGYILIGLIFTYSFFVTVKSFFWIWLVWTIGFFTIFIEYLVEKRKTSITTFDIEKSWTLLCRFILGIMYIFMMFGFAGPIIAKVNGDQLLTLGLGSAVGTDAFAYFIGRARGTRKLWPELSPGKTVEGAIGGCVGAVVSALFFWGVFKLTMANPVPVWEAIVIGLFGGPLSQAGDFMESLMKRVAGRKDSGSLIPGHGGVLDRADSLVFMMPLVYFLF